VVKKTANKSRRETISGSQNKKTQKFSWNGGSCCGEAFNKKIDDVLFINSLVDKLIKQYNIDSKRVYLTGFSNGALLTYKIAAEAPEKFSAFAIVSGSIGGKIKASDPYYYLRLPKKAVPILIMHGQKDALIPYLGGLNPEKTATFTSFEESTDFWIKNNNAKKKYSFENENLIHNSYETTDNTANIETYTFKVGGHAWFGGVMEFKKIIMRKSVSATDIIGNFFKLNNKLQ
jgi:polyhydroxybutyrate depolymerase